MIKIAFSGPNHSGKTTTLTKVYEALLEKGVDVIVFSENMHRLMQGKSIDEIRANPELYLEIQEKCIEERMQFEYNLHPSSDTVVLMDRPMTDSLYYLTHYLDKKALSEAAAVRYDNLVTKTETFCKAFMPTLSRCLVFYPINKPCEDKTFRPDNVDAVKFNDYLEMRTLVETHVYGEGPKNTTVQYINYNRLNQNIVVDRLVTYITNKLK